MLFNPIITAGMIAIKIGENFPDETFTDIIFDDDTSMIIGMRANGSIKVINKFK